MKNSRFYLLTACFLLPLFAAPAQASTVCDPKTLGSTGSCIGQPCDYFGSSTMDANQENIIVCLKDGVGGQKWKSMTSSLSAPVAVPTETTITASSNGYLMVQVEATTTFRAPIATVLLDGSSYASVLAQDSNVAGVPSIIKNSGVYPIRLGQKFRVNIAPPPSGDTFPHYNAQFISIQ